MSVPNCVIETDEWRLGCYFQWRAKPVRVKCTACGGDGKTSGLFDLDGPQTCQTCWGAGSVERAPTTPPPPVPAAIQEHMRRAWWDFVNGPLPEPPEVKP